MIQYFLPTKIITQSHCLDLHSHELSAFGKKALIVTGKSSEKNGSLNDLTKALKKEHISYVLFNEVLSNPDIALAREVANSARNEQVDFLIGLGGGSPMDCAKAAALLVHNDLDDAALFEGIYKAPILPIVAIPTTAGTGSEVTQYSILNNKLLETKTSLSHPALFPKVAFLDARYMMGLSQKTTIHTTLDALSHAIEGYLSVKATPYSNLFAKKSIELLSDCLFDLKNELSLEKRSVLLEASTLAGIVIAHSGTTAVHALGYSLTYFKKVDHGHANALLLAEYLQFLNKTHPNQIQDILTLLHLKTLADFSALLDELLDKPEKLSTKEADLFVDKALQTKNITNSLEVPTRADLLAILEKSL